MKNGLLLVAMVLGGVGVASAGTPSGASMCDSLAASDSLSRISAGFDAQVNRRNVALFSGKKERIEDNVQSVEVGVNLFSWWQFFGTVGRSKVNWAGNDSAGMQYNKWSGGMHFKWGGFDIDQPNIMNGRLSFQNTVEFTQYRSDNNTRIENDTRSDNDVPRWSDTYADLTLNLDIYSKTQKDTQLIPYAFTLYGGPAFSTLSGHLNGSDLSENQKVGIVGGADIFFTYNCSIGAQVLFIDTRSFDMNVRYRF